MKILTWLSMSVCVVALACGGDDGSGSSGATESADGGMSTTMGTTVAMTAGETTEGMASGGGTTSSETSASTAADTTAGSTAGTTDTGADTAATGGSGATTGAMLGCIECTAQECPAAADDCVADPECMCIYDCLQGGDNPGQCNVACDHPQGDAVDAFFDCIDGPCTEAC